MTELEYGVPASSYAKASEDWSSYAKASEDWSSYAKPSGDWSSYAKPSGDRLAGLVMNYSGARNDKPARQQFSL